MSKVHTHLKQVQALLDSDPRFEDAVLGHCYANGIEPEVVEYYPNLAEYLEKNPESAANLKRTFKENPRLVEYKQGEALLVLK